MRLQLSVFIKAVQQLGVRTDIADERLHEYQLLAVGFVGEAACTQLADDSTSDLFKADCSLIRAHSTLIWVYHSSREGLIAG